MKTVVIVSGGMDSITLLHHCKEQCNQIKALSFDYGQRHVRELQFAKKACKKLGIEWKLVNLKSVTSLISNSALTGNMKVPYGHYENETMKLTVVPNRNMIMLSIAIGYAENLGFNYVAYAAHAGDHAIYPDCRPEFASMLELASKFGTYNKIKFYTPFIDMKKGVIALIGIKNYKIDYDKETWSCYEGKNKACKKCGTCVERQEALEYARNTIKSQDTK